MARLPRAGQEELPKGKEQDPQKSGAPVVDPDDPASVAAQAAVRQAEADLKGLEGIVERVRGFIALAQSFHEAGDHSESVNLSLLARAEIAKSLRAGSMTDTSTIRLRYVLPNLGNPEESSWIVQTERVAYDRAIKDVAAGLGLVLSEPQQDGSEEEIEMATEAGELELRLRRRAVRAEDAMVVQITGVSGDPALFRAVSAAVRQRLVPISEYVEKFASVPPPAEGDLQEYLKTLSERMNAQVEELIILHADGRMMCHVTSALSSGIDYDLVGSMLLALRAFVRDSFSGDFEEVGFAEKRMLLVQGNHVLAALLMHGEVSDGFRAAVKTSLSRMEDALRSEILNWIGLSSLGEKMLPYLETLVKGARLGTPP